MERGQSTENERRQIATYQQNFTVGAGRNRPEPGIGTGGIRPLADSKQATNEKPGFGDRADRKYVLSWSNAGS
jgi:hypothetical protein